MSFALEALEIQEVSLVDRGANEAARVVLVKQKGAGMEITVLEKRLAEAEAARGQLQKRLATLEAERALADAVVIAKREIGALPGSDAEKGQAWQALEHLADASVRATLQRLLRAGAAAQAALQEPKGVSAEAETGGSMAALQARAEAKAKADGITVAAAMAALLAEDPGLYDSVRRER